MKFTSLLHHVTTSLLVESFYDLKRNAAAGVDGVTWREYEKALYTRVHDLHREIHPGAYRGQASRRVYIPKADGKMRPLGIAALEGKPETFDFPGFTHCCGKTRKGWFSVLRVMVKKRMRATLKAVRAKFRSKMHDDIPLAGKWLRRVVQGYFNDFAVPGNGYRLCSFRSEICRAWRRRLFRRSQRHCLFWERFQRLANRYIPPCIESNPRPKTMPIQLMRTLTRVFALIGKPEPLRRSGKEIDARVAGIDTQGVGFRHARRGDLPDDESGK